jgi:hypothetical protein
MISQRFKEKRMGLRVRCAEGKKVDGNLSTMVFCFCYSSGAGMK